MLESIFMNLIRNGYSLIETVIVIIILAILSAGIFVYIGFYKSFNLDAASEKLASDIRYAQNLSMSTSTWNGIIFYANPSNVYSVYTTTGTQDTIIADPSDLSKSFTINLSDKFGTTIYYVSIPYGNKIEFSPLGQPYADKTGDIISSESTITLTSGSFTKTIRIIKNTGKVTIQ